MKKRKDVSGVGNRINILRTEALQMTQEQLAEALGITRETLSRYESGRAAVPQKRIRELQYYVESKTGKRLNVVWLNYGDGEIYEIDELLKLREKNRGAQEQQTEDFINICVQVGVEVRCDGKGRYFFIEQGEIIWSVNESVFQQFVETFSRGVHDFKKSIVQSILDTYLNWHPESYIRPEK